MPLRNRLVCAGALLLLTGGGLALPSAASGQRTAPTAPSPLDEPPGTGPRGTSQAVPGEQRYDAVGYSERYDARQGGSPATAMVAAHRSLPVGSFAEVTALDSGKTIIVLIAVRGTLSTDREIALSDAAVQALGFGSDGTGPVRVRLVDPAAPDQASLRAGRAASTRLDAPQVLLTGLRRRLPPAPAYAARAGSPGATSTTRSTPRSPAAAASPGRAAGRKAGQGHYFVQVAAFSSAPRAQSLADALGGRVLPGGGFYRVRLGPFADSAAAARVRDDAARRGYSDARVLTDN